MYALTILEMEQEKLFNLKIISFITCLVWLNGREDFAVPTLPRQTRQPFFVSCI